MAECKSTAGRGEAEGLLTENDGVLVLGGHVVPDIKRV